MSTKDNLTLQPDSELLTLKEASEILSCHPNTLRQWDKKGIITSLRFGKRGDRRFRRQDVQNLLSQQSSPTKTKASTFVNAKDYEVIAKITNDAIWDWNLDTNELKWSDGIETLFGYPKHKIDQQVDWWYQRIHPDDRDRVISSLHTNIREGARTWKSEYWFQKQDSSYAYVFDKGLIVKNKDGRACRLLGAMVDITKRKRAQDALRQCESKYRTLFTNMTEGFALGDLVFSSKGQVEDVRFIEINKAFTEQTGLSYDILRRPLKTILPHLESTWVEHYATVALTGKSERFTDYNQDTNRHYEVYAYCPETGKFAISFRDVTAQIHDKQMLTDSEQKFRTLADNISQLAWMANPDGYIFWYNQRWHTYTGTTPETMKGWDWQRVHHPDFVEAVTKKFKKAVKSGQIWEDTFPLKRADGEYRWFLSRAQPITNSAGKIVRWFGTNTDITQQREAEQRFRDLADAMPQLVWTANPNGEVDYYNQRHTDLEGIKKLGKKYTWAPVLHPDDLALTLKAWRKAVETKSIYQIEHRVKTKQGDYKWYLSRGIPVKDEQGAVLKWYGTATDINDQKETENQLRTSQQQKDQFIGIASHELKTPVTSLKAYAQILKKRLGSSVDDKSSLLIDRVNAQIDKLNLLISDLLDVTRLQAGKLQLRKEKFDLNQFLLEVIEQTQLTTDTHTISSKLCPTLKLHADKDRLSQVIINLLTNAIKYSPKSNQVSLETKATDTRILITVKDNGIGIPKNEQKKIFEQFYRSSNGSTTTLSGVGLGLFISSEIVRRHGGSISVESQEGKGSRFTVSLKR